MERTFETSTLAYRLWYKCTMFFPVQVGIKRAAFKLRKAAKIRDRYNQVPHLTQDTNGKVTNSQLDTTNKSQEVSPFPAGDHKAQIKRRIQSHSKTRKIHTKSTALEWSVKYFTGGLKSVLCHANLTLNSDVDQDT